MNRMNQDEQPPQQNARDRILELTIPGWLHLRMPSEFTYTGAALLNNVSQGLLHTFIRHWDQWETVIPEIRTLLQGELAPIQQFLQQIQSARTSVTARNAAQNLQRFLSSCCDEGLLSKFFFRIFIFFLFFLI